MGWLPGRLGSELTAPPPLKGMIKVPGNLKSESRPLCFIAWKRDGHGLSWVCLHEHMCTSSFYVNLEKLILESEEKVRTVKIKNKTTAK